MVLVRRIIPFWARRLASNGLGEMNRRCLRIPQRRVVSRSCQTWSWVGNSNPTSATASPAPATEEAANPSQSGRQKQIVDTSQKRRLVHDVIISRRPADASTLMVMGHPEVRVQRTVCYEHKTIQ